MLQIISKEFSSLEGVKPLVTLSNRGQEHIEIESEVQIQNLLKIWDFFSIQKEG